MPVLAELVSTRDKAETVGGRERQKVRQSVHSESDEPSQHNMSHSQQTHEGHRDESKRDGRRENSPNAHPALGCRRKLLISQQHTSHQALPITLSFTSIINAYSDLSNQAMNLSHSQECE